MKRVNRVIRLLLVAVALSLVLVVALGIRSRFSGGPAGQPSPIASQGDDLLVIPDFRHAQYEGERLAWELRARKATFRDMTHASLAEPTMVIHSRDRGPVTVSFPSGTIDLAAKDLSATGPALLRTEDGYTVTTGDLTYVGKDDRMVTVSGFTVEGRRLRAQGRNLTVFPGTRRFEASGEIRVLYFPAAAAVAG